ncbi:universal stress protein [Botryobacter ruber]|uniref:universal stress protein n=1 Tax=Botryobacter ruber TaxID=2171629 RepID=UPI000E0A479C|nr:universal stress protein [Botryobacter ruber]
METILCPADFSLCSQNAVKYAHELAQLMRARLLLFHWEPATAKPVAVLSNGQEYADQLHDAPDQPHQLEALALKLKNDYPESTVPVEVIPPGGPGGDTLTELFRQEKIDLVIVGYDMQEEFQQTFTATDLAVTIEKASCPVLIIPQQATFKPIWKIVYATDLKSEPAADCAFLLRLAHLFNAEIMLLHVLAQDGAGARELAIEALQKVYSKLPYRNVSFYIEASEVVEAGISEFISKNNADMLVVSNHPRKKCQHLLAGKFPHNTAYHMQLPLLIRQTSAQ